MKLWNKSKFELVDRNGFRRLIFDTWPYEARDLLNEVVYPIQITDCDSRKVYAFTDANGREFNCEVFAFHPSECLFDTNHREFFKKFNYNKQLPGKNSPTEYDILKLVDSAHLLGNITVNRVQVKKKGQLAKLLQQAGNKQ